MRRIHPCRSSRAEARQPAGHDESCYGKCSAKRAGTRSIRGIRSVLIPVDTKLPLLAGRSAEDSSLTAPGRDLERSQLLFIRVLIWDPTPLNARRQTINNTPTSTPPSLTSRLGTLWSFRQDRVYSIAFEARVNTLIYYYMHEKVLVPGRRPRAS